MNENDKIKEKIINTVKARLTDTSFEDKLNYALEGRSIKVCKEFGLTPQETAEKLKLNLAEVKLIYGFDDKGLIDWSSDI